MRRLGRYGLLEPLGSGGMGTVYAGVLVGARNFRRPVAIKVLDRDLTGPEAEAWLEEARIGGMLAHPNVVPTIDVGREQGQSFLVMERVEGGSVAAMVREKALSPAAVLDLGAQAANGLAYLHDLGLVHGDVKPQNLLVDGTGLVRIVDFGVAALRGLGAVLGTLNYMAPEHTQGTIEPASDVFSLAMTLHVAATRRRLLLDTPLARRALVVRALVADEEPWQRLDAAVPGLGPVLRAASAAEPRDRPRADELAKQLRALAVGAEGEPLVERVIPMPIEAHEGRPGRFVGRRAERRALKHAVMEGGVVLVTGPAGSGKSRLVAETVLAPRVDLRGVRTREGLIQRVAATLDLKIPAETPGWWWNAVLPPVVVLDDAEGVVPWLARVLERTRGTVVVTSRVRFEAGAVIEVGPLNQDEALALVREIRTEPTAELEALVASVDRLPLVLEVVAGSDQPMANLHEQLAGSALEDALQLSWDLLDVHARRTLAAMATFRGSLGLEDLAAVAGPRGLVALAALLQHNLVEARGDRVALLEQVRQFVEGRGPVPREAHARWLSRLGTDDELERLQRTGNAPPGQRFRALLAEVGNLDDAIDWAASERRADLLGPLVRARLAVFQRQGPVDAMIALIERCRPTVEPADRAWLDERHAWALERRARFAEAVELAAGAFASTSARGVQSDCLRREGINRLYLGQVDVAWARTEQALDLATEVGDLPRIAEAHLNAAIVASAQGDRKRCEHHNREAIRVGRSIGYVMAEAMGMGNLAREHVIAGAYEKAERLQRKAVERFERVGDRMALQNARALLGAIHLERGELEAARARLEEVREDAAAMGLKAERMHYAGMLGEVEALAGRTEVAASLLAQVEEQSPGRALIAVLRSFVLRLQGRPRRALALLEQAESRQPIEAAHLDLERALVLLDLGRAHEAQPMAKRALQAFRERSRSTQVALGLLALARAEKALGSPQPALIQQAQKIVELLEVGPRSRVTRDLESALRSYG